MLGSRRFALGSQNNTQGRDKTSSCKTKSMDYHSGVGGSMKHSAYLQ